jgi:hypothetical protein
MRRGIRIAKWFSLSGYGLALRFVKLHAGAAASGLGAQGKPGYRREVGGDLLAHLLQHLQAVTEQPGLGGAA